MCAHVSAGYDDKFIQLIIGICAYVSAGYDDKFIRLSKDIYDKKNNKNINLYCIKIWVNKISGIKKRAILLELKASQSNVVPRLGVLFISTTLTKIVLLVYVILFYKK